MATPTKGLVNTPKGYAQLLAVAPGGAAGTLTCVGGIKVGDKIIQALAVNAVTVATAPLDLTSEFTVTGTNTVSNAAGTATTSCFVMIVYARARKNAG